MGFKCGIVGLPNVGKSSLFNSLSNKAQAESANYPFCTIEPNKASVAVPDDRLAILQKIENSENIVPTHIDIIDIAGIISGAHNGEGLGNKFLGHIREVDVIMMVVRCFDDERIIHVNNKIDPVNELEILTTELALADIDVLEKKLTSEKKNEKSNKSSNSELIQRMIEMLGGWSVTKWIKLTEEYRSNPSTHPIIKEICKNSSEEESFSRFLKEMHLLTMKPLLIICNVNENDIKNGNQYTKNVQNATTHLPLIISAKLEEEICGIEDKTEILSAFGVEKTGLDRIIQAGYSLLNCMTFFTVGPMEVRAWTIKRGENAQDSAGKIHSDIAEGFIKAEVISYEDFTACGSRNECKNQGKLRIEGRDYITREGDIMLFKFK